MLHFRRNHGSSSLLEDATKVRDHAVDGLSKARRSTARGLESAASVVDQQQPRKRRGRKPLLLAVLAGVAGWVAVKASRKGREVADELTETASGTTAKATENVAGDVATAAEKVADEADEVRKTQRQHAKSSNAARS
jgi:hypothetical protein